jgi:hypothetical protein
VIGSNSSEKCATAASRPAGYDIIVEACFFDQQRFLDFISNRPGRMQGITRLETSIIFDVVKFSPEDKVA